MSKEWINRITMVQRDEIKELSQIGFSDVELGRLYGVHHSSIYYYTKDLERDSSIGQDEKLKRASKILNLTKEEIDKTIKIITTRSKKIVPDIQTKGQKHELKRGRTYQDYLKIEKERKDELLKNCKHERWVKRCSFCNKILESDSTIS